MICVSLCLSMANHNFQAGAATRASLSACARCGSIAQTRWVAVRLAIMAPNGPAAARRCRLQPSAAPEASDLVLLSVDAADAAFAPRMDPSIALAAAAAATPPILFWAWVAVMEQRRRAAAAAAEAQERQRQRQREELKRKITGQDQAARLADTENQQGSSTGGDGGVRRE